ncbi:MAG: alpha/beta fold hydrolase, partial [Gorillibacterium sp.]|nr:alpha/beta fold hydrolase [Gorillibacterium sp.]
MELDTVPEKRACLLLHGFTGAPYEVEPLAQHLELAGWECHLPTLAGHGGDLRQLKPVSHMDWIKSAQEKADSLANTHESFDLIGFSMSGLIAAFLANRYPVRRLVLLNAAVIYVSPVRLLANVIERLHSQNDKNYVNKNKTPASAVIEFMKLVRELKPELGHVEVPTMVVQGGRDPIVHPFSSGYIMHKLKGQ